ncbi:unnamed protein product, partial [Ixodes pacificus]
ESDPAKWPAAVSNKFQTQCIEKGPQYFRNRSEHFRTSKRQYTSQKRYLPPQVFVRKAANGEVFERHWLMHILAVERVCVLFHVEIFAVTVSVLLQLMGFATGKRRKKKPELMQTA